MVNHLPEELKTDIISRLPFDRVLECKLVCKSWRTLISNPSFAQMHLRRSLHLLHDNDDEVVYHNPTSAANVSFISQIQLFGTKESELYYGEYNENDAFKKLTKIIHPPIDSYSNLYSCNGLICLTRNTVESDVYICNPIMREYIILPRLVFKTPFEYCADGFGYHHKTKEYKFVRIYYKDDNSVGQVYVYTLGSDCGWRNIGEINYDFSNSSSLFANGFLHWVECRDGEIVSFDLADEVFRVLPLQPCYYDDGCYEYDMMVLGGRFSVVYKDESDDCLKVWSLKLKKKEEKGSNYNTKEWTWSLEFKTQWEGTRIYSLIFLTKSNEILLLDGDRRLCRHNLGNASNEVLVDYAPGTEIYATILHTNSFVSQKAMGEDAKTIRSAEQLNVKKKMKKKRKRSVHK